MLKKIILLVLISFGIISCKKDTDKKIAKTNIEKFLAMNINSPNYYELIDMTDLVTLSEKEYYSFMKASDEKTSQDIYEMVLKDSEKKTIVTEVNMRIKNKFNSSEKLITLRVALSDSLTVENLSKK
ncbi:hypothetical protein BFR04_06960 [Gaetbulibacter sp. 4G1]|nr:hypothetical protein [Gaetbulibacter sp. 4G1]PIA77967.1 hypothetical protein BFR04_06960 [Gaetbulibacter sp. 4G1]